MRLDKTEWILLAVAVALMLGGFVAPQWLVFLLTIALAKGLVVQGVVMQMRAGLPLSRELTNAMGKAEAVAAQIAGRAKELADVVGRTPEAEAQRSPSPRREASASFNT